MFSDQDVGITTNLSQETVDILVPKNGTVQDIVDCVVKKAQLDDEAKGGPIRVYESQNHKFAKEPLRETSILSITDYSLIIVERIPEEELEAKELAYVAVYHFQNEPSKAHGIPFKFLINPDEKFSDTKKRLEKRTGLKGKNFEKIKFATVKRSMYATPQYLNDGKHHILESFDGLLTVYLDDILYDMIDPDSDQLGLDHPDRSRNARNGAGDLFLK
jgi:ubiquitin carboxyl-terminal hydrolase 7